MKSFISFWKKYHTRILNILGFLGLLFGVYSYYFPIDQNPNLIYYEKSKVDVFKLNDTIDNLEVYFKGKDIRKQKLNLKVYKLKLVNNGRSGVQVTDYDKNIPFGIQVKNAFIINAEIIDSGDSYISKELNPNFKDSTKLIFNNIIIDKDKYVEFKLIIAHNIEIEPELYPLGKISNTNITISQEKEDTDTDWIDVFYFFGIIALGLLGIYYLAVFAEVTFEFLQLKWREIVMRKKYDHIYDPSNKIHRLMVKIYSVTGKKKFYEILYIIQNNKKLNYHLKLETENENAVKRFFLLKKNNKISSSESEFDYYSEFLEVIDILTESNLIEKGENGSINISSRFLNEIEQTLKLF